LNLLSEESLWVFLSGSNEVRFLMDISFGIECLRHRNIKPEQILVFIDSEGVWSTQGYAFPTGIKIYPTSQLGKVLKDLVPLQLTLVVTGHGNVNGISAQRNIKPYELLSIVKGIDSLKCALVVLGQCYAGTFNYLDVRSTAVETSRDKLKGNSTEKSDGKILPDICIIGATNLHFSISYFVNLSNVSKFRSFQCPKSWVANIFLMHFMTNVAFPDDIDGDGLYSVMDTYKSAGILSNQDLIEINRRNFTHLLNLHKDFSADRDDSRPLLQQLREKTIREYGEVLGIFLNQQNPWILHANFARNLLL
jgi:hypothetical protein